MNDPGVVVLPAAGPGPARAATDPGHHRLGPIRRGIREVGLAMIAGGVVVLAFVGYQLYGTTLSEQRAQTSLSRDFAADQAHGGAPAVAASVPAGADAPTIAPPTGTGRDLSPATPVGSAIEHLVIPKIGLDRYVVQGTDEQDLMKGPGHYVGTPFPGQKGNAAIAGHRTTYGAPFFRLDELADGDRIEVTNTKGRTFVFSVIRHLVVAPSGPGATAVLADTADAELTLTTCNPRFEATNRLVVVAALVGAPAAAAAASPTRAAPRRHPPRDRPPRDRPPLPRPRRPRPPRPRPTRRRRRRPRRRRPRSATGTPTGGPRRSSTARRWWCSGRRPAWRSTAPAGGAGRAPSPSGSSCAPCPCGFASRTSCASCPRASDALAPTRPHLP